MWYGSIVEIETLNCRGVKLTVSDSEPDDAQQKETKGGNLDKECG